MRKAPFLRVRAWLRTASIAVATGTALLPLWADNPSPTPPSALESQLLEACQNLDVPVITDLVKQGVRATACDSSGETPLMLTVNRPDIVQILLGDKPDLDLRGPDGATALYLACAANDDSSARELIAAGANPNLTVRSNLRSPLLAAIENNDPDLAVLLVQHRADPNHGFSGGTPIACAVSREQVEVTRALLEAGVPEELPKFDAAGHPQIPLVEKAALDDNTAMLDLLLAHGGSVEETDSVGGTPLLLTLLVGKADAVDYLLAKGADVNHSDTKGDSTLVTALCHQKPRVWQVLLDHGAKIDAVNTDGKSALMIMAGFADARAVRFLLDHGANVNLADAQGETALTYAGNRGMAEMVDWLKDAGATRTDLHVIRQSEAQPPLSPRCRWELAVGAIYALVDGGNPNLLDGGYSVTRAQHLLVSDWKLADRDSLLSRIAYLISPGERAGYQLFGQNVPPNVVPLQGEYGGLGDKLELERRNYATWKDASGLAGDLCRASHLASLGFAAGWLSRAEAWKLLDQAATAIQAHFDSWTSMGNNFLDSSEMWRGGVDPRFESCGALLANAQDSNSPWTQLPWLTPLATASPAAPARLAPLPSPSRPSVSAPSTPTSTSKDFD